jgi:Uma2 family endonuclease
MSTIMLAHQDVRIPAGFASLNAYRKWAKSDDYPSHGWFSYLAGDLYVDFSMEQAFSHNNAKGRYCRVLDQLTESFELGYFFYDGMLLSNPEAKLSTEPDGMLVTYEAIETGQARLIDGSDGGYVEVEGTPDMALEVISASSLKKDTEILPDLYAKAGIDEYWLVDARSDELQFDILRLSGKRYTKTRKQPGGWLKSNMFARSFRLVTKTDRLGNPQFTLEVRDK